MQVLKLFSILVFSVLFLNKAIGQNQTTDQIIKVTDDVQQMLKKKPKPKATTPQAGISKINVPSTDQIQKLTNDVQQLFRKKQKPKTEAPQGDISKIDPEMPGPDNVKSEANNNDKSGLKPGDVAPNAKVIDADYFYPFNKGAAVVVKGGANGLIDASGNFIIPYNKYRSIYQNISAIPTVGNGIFIVNGGDSGAVNSKGQLITKGIPCLMWGLGGEDGTLAVCAMANPKSPIPTTYVDAEGHKYQLKQDLESIAEGIGIFVEKPTYKRGYKNLKDEWIVKPIYDRAFPFSEGMACVGKKDDFGGIKYGFIDRTGREVIPLQYSNLPTNFHGGLALVIPKDQSEFMQAYIDKSGKIVQKSKTPTYDSYVGNGMYRLTHFHVMDSTGLIMTDAEFLQSLGVVLDPGRDKALSLQLDKYYAWNGHDDGKICFTRTSKQAGIAPSYGHVNMKTKLVVEGTFEYRTNLLATDPVSKLSVAGFNISGKIMDKTPLREGYVNEQGIFVIVKAAGAKW